MTMTKEQGEAVRIVREHNGVIKESVVRFTIPAGSAVLKVDIKQFEDDENAGVASVSALLAAGFQER